MEVIEKSPLETEEPCPHFGMCGGCTYQTVPYEGRGLDMKTYPGEKAHFGCHRH